MQKLALDTNAYTALGRGSKSLAELISSAAYVGMPIVVLGEIHYGNFNGSLQQKNQTVLSNFLADSRVEILHIDEQTARLFGEIATTLRSAGKPIQQDDIWIAALCKQYRYQLLTNDHGFGNILGLEVVAF